MSSSLIRRPRRSDIRQAFVVGRGSQSGTAAGPPTGPPTANPLMDAAVDMALAVRDAERRLKALPAPASRSADERAAAAAAHAAARAGRRRFLGRHVVDVYRQLTSGGTVRLTLADLVYAAAEAFPGLTPTRAQIAEEQSRHQADKEGREIDQALFVHAVLSCPAEGGHLLETMLAPSDRAHDLLGRFQREGRLDLGPVLMELRERIAHVTIRNLACLNAEDDALADALETAVDLVALDENSRVGVLRGDVMTHPKYAGRRVFCAGINLRKLHQGQIPLIDFLLRREIGLIAKLWRGVATSDDGSGRTTQKPWIAAVDGFAIGGGMQMLLVFDHVIAEQSAYFSLPAAQEGIVPGAANLRLARIAGSRLARRIILDGQTIHATDPEAALFCDEVVPAQGMDAAVADAARRMDGPAVAANRRMLNLLEETPEQFRVYMAEFALEQADRLYSPDVMEKSARFAGRDR